MSGVQSNSEYAVRSITCTDNNKDNRVAPERKWVSDTGIEIPCNFNIYWLKILKKSICEIIKACDC